MTKGHSPFYSHRKRKKSRRGIRRDDVEFNCKLTEEVRGRLRERRRALSLSYEQVAQFLGVNWSTFRKWEEGPTQSCSRCHRRKIESFLNGDFDRQLLDQADEPVEEPSTQPIRLCMERLVNTYVLCQNHPEIALRLIVRLEEIARTAIEELISNGGSPVGTQAQNELQEELDAFEESKNRFETGWDCDEYDA